MKHLKVTSVVLSIAICMSMFMPSVSVIADEAAAPSETAQSTEETEKQTPKETEKSKETEKQTPKETEKPVSKETEKEEPEDTEKETPAETSKEEPSATETKEPAETEKKEPVETEETQPAETEKQEPAETENKVPEQTEAPEASEPSETDEQTPAVTEERVPETEVKKEAKLAASGTCGTNISWSLDDNGKLTISGSGAMTSHPWKSYKTNIKTVVIEGSVTSLCSSAFDSCANMVSISIPSSVTSIGSYAFYSCSSLKSISLPSELKKINAQTFQYCSSLGNVTIPSKVTSIDSQAFDSCSSFTSVTIPDSVTSIGSSAFANCTSLASVTCSKSIKEIDTYLFYNCKSLKSFTIPSGVTSIGGSAFRGCSLTSVSIPSGVTKIGSYAFSGCSLTSVNIPSGITIIKEGTFSGNKFTSITLPSSLTEIESDAFSKCSELKSVSIPSGVWNIEGGAFMGCSKLTSVSLPQSVTEIGWAAFQDCSALTGITLPDNMEYIAGSIFEGCTSLSKIIIPNTVTDIQSGAFAGCVNLKEITIPSGVKLIGDRAFENCRSFSSITLPSGITVISDGLLKGCTGISEISLPSGITSIGESSFQGCTGLKSVSIPSHVENIWSSAFAGCSTLADVYYDSTETDWNSIKVSGNNGPLLNATLHAKESSFNGDSGSCGDGLSWTLDTNGTLTIIGSGAMGDYDNYDGSEYYYIAPWSKYKTRIKKVVFSGSVTSIGNGAFSGCFRLTSISIPSSVKSIGLGAFSRSGITSVTIPSTVTSIGSRAFEECTDLTGITISDGVVSIGDKAFTFSGLKSVVIPGTVTTFGKSIFSQCANLTNVTINSGVTNISEGAFYKCAKLSSVSIPNTVKTIGENAFYYSGLTEIKLPSGVTTIGNSAFYGSSSLKSVSLPNTISSIGSSAFNGTGITSLTIPGSLKSGMGYFAFANCHSLEKVILLSGVTRLEDDSFSGCNKLTSITIPKTLTRINSYSFSGCEKLAEVNYEGTQNDWSKINIEDLGNEVLNSVQINYNTTTVTYYSVTVSYGEGGTATVSANTAKKGDKITVTAKPVTGYTLDTITVNGTALGAGETSFTMGTSDVAVYVTFKKVQYKITVSVPNGGGTATAATAAYAGETVLVNCNPATGYVLDKIVVYDSTQTGTSFTMRAQETTVSVSFKMVDYNVEVIAGSNGTATADKTTAHYGDTVTITAKPATGYVLDKIIAGETTLASNKYSFTMGAGDITVKVYFKKSQYTISLTYPNGGGSATAPAMADAGDMIEVVATPATGYAFDHIVVEGKQYSNMFTMPAKNTTVSVYFKKVAFNIDVSKTAGGTVTVKSTAYYQEEVTVTATPATGYERDYISVDGKTITGNTFTMPARDTEVYVAFKLKNYTVTVAETSNGSATVDKNPAHYHYGDTVNVNPKPATGYVLDKVYLNDTAITGTSFTMPAKDSTVKVTFKKAVYNVTYNKPEGGTVKVLPTTASYKDTITVTVTASTGYALEYIKVNDSKIDGNTFEMPARDAAVEVSFKKINYSIIVTYGSNGTAKVNSNTANYGDQIVVQATPSKGYTVDTITVNGVALDPGVIEFTMPNGVARVHVTFKKAQYSISVLTPDNCGTARAVTMANEGDSITVSYTPKTGYELDYITLDGAAISGDTFEMPDGSVIVRVYFKKSVYSLSINKPAGGKAELTKTSANYNDKITVNVTPDAGYELDQILVNGRESDRTFYMPAENAAVTVSFKKIVYKINVKKTVNGTVKVANDKETATIGEKISFTATGDTGYIVDTIKVNGQTQTANYFTMGAGDATIEVTFKKKQFAITVKCSAGGKAHAEPNTAGIDDMVSVICNPDNGYELDSIKVNGEKSEQSFLMPAQATTVNVTFKKTDYEIEVAGDGHGTGYVDKNPANIGDKITITDVPDAGYELDSIRLNGNPFSGKTFTMGAGWTTVELYFKLKDLKVTVKALTGGTATLDKATAKMGDTVNLTVTPLPGYELDYIQVYDKQYKKATSFKMGSENAEVTVAFKKITYTITLSVDKTHGNANIEGGKTTGVIGDTIIVNAQPDTNYYPVIKVNGDEIVGNTFPIFPANVKVNVTFEKVKPLDVGESETLGAATYTVTGAAPENGVGAVRLDKIADDGTAAVVVPDTVDIKGVTYRVTSIGNNALANNQSMTSLNIGAYVVSLGSNAVYNCKNLVKITGGLRLKTIGTKAFASCPKLKSFTISSGVLSKISAYSFNGDKSLKTIYVNKTTKLTKKGVKKSLKGSKVKTVKVKKSKVKKYKKYFTKKNCGRKVKVKK